MRRLTFHALFTSSSAVLTVEDNTSMARWLQARLIPDHKDAPATQRKANAVALHGLTDEQHQALLGRFFHTDDMSFDEYLHKV